MGSSVRYKTSGLQTRGPSPILFADYPDDVMWDPNQGITVWTDFTSIMKKPTASNLAGYSFGTAAASSYESNSASIVGNTNVGGGITMTTPATDNLMTLLEFGDGTLGPFNLNFTGSGATPLSFETSLKLGQIVTQDVFCGLVLPGASLTVNSIFTTADAFVTTQGFVGFWILAANSNEISCGYQAASQALQTSLAAAANPAVAAATYKLGFKFDPLDSTAGLKFYVNEVLVCAVSLATLNAATFPSATAMVPALNLQNSAAAGNTVSFDWLRCTQVSP
jgi:hypothetical protein